MNFNLSLIKYLLLGIILLTAIVIIGTWKLKKLPIIVNSTKSDKIETVTLLKKLWEKQIVMNVIAITLFSIIAFYDFKGTKTFETVIGGISLVFVAVSALLTVNNYNKFKSEFAKIVEKLKK